MRIVHFLPSATELAFALGLGDVFDRVEILAPLLHPDLGPERHLGAASRISIIREAKS
jgi:hypothetical protein